MTAMAFEEPLEQVNIAFRKTYRTMIGVPVPVKNFMNLFMRGQGPEGFPVACKGLTVVFLTARKTRLIATPAES